MFLNLPKSLKKTYRIIASSSRFITSQKDIYGIKEKEEEIGLEIETGLFNNSSVKYEPIKKEVLLRGTKKFSKKAASKHIISRPQETSSLRRTLTERKAESQLINDHDLGMNFVKLSLNDPRLNSLLTTARSKKRRDKDRQIIIEGRRLILEALKCGLKLYSVIFSQKEKLLDIKENLSQAQKQYKTEIYKVPHHDLKIWSSLTNPPGVMAIFERPTSKEIVEKTNSEFSLPITVVCDNIREPNNLGSIIRTCAALPCLQIIITRGCCDPWESKALRGGCGGHFRLPIKDDIEWHDVPLMIPPEFADTCCIFVAENNLEKLHNKTTITEYSEIGNIGLHNVVIIGGESHGVSQDAYRFLEKVGPRGKCLYIPLARGIESLNVVSALTLILYELRRNIHQSKYDQ